MTPVASKLRRVARASAVPMLLLSAFGSSVAQVPVRRLFQLPASAEARVAVPGSVTARPAKSLALGHLSGDTALTGMSLVLKPTAAQDAALTQLLADQQNPSSPSYHQWLTPAQFGARFGVAQGDIALLQTWLQSKGFSVDAVAASQNRIVFSGTAAAVESAFSVNLERYHRGDQDFFENSAEVNLPASLSAVVSGITGLSSYRLPAPPHSLTSVPTATPDYTSSTTTGTAHYLVPWDFRQIFGINSLVSSGFDGTGITIGVLGQSAVDSQQLTYFQQKTGQTVKLPTMTLVPNTGVSNKKSGDEGESELDLEYASGTAPGATVQFIYTGCTNTTSSTVLGDSVSCGNNGVFDAMAYAVTNKLAQILTLSYGSCEADNASFATSSMEPYLRQASVQGQTVLVSSGDTGATSCETTTTAVATGGLSVSYPASSPNVVAVGGTQLNGDTSAYWSSTNNAFAGSAIGYIPEVAWNDTVAYKSLSVSGGGASRIFGKPSWQTGTGVPADGKRDVPDVAFPASVEVNAYVICSVGAACTNGTLGFATGGGGGLVGGTSAAAPNFAAMLAVIEQANGGGALGNIAPTLYSLAAGTSGATIFHDVTSGNNIVSCQGGTTGCSSTSSATAGTMGYTAGVGYDQVTGLGSIAANTLQPALKTIASTIAQTPTVTLFASSLAPTTGSALTFSAAVAANGTAVASGTVTFTVDGTSIGTGTLSSTGTTSISYAGFSTAGAHVVVATYPYAGGTISATLNLTVTVPGGLTASAASTSVTVKAGGTTTNAITVTATGGFAGTVNFTAALTSSNGASFSGCYSLPSVTLAAGASAPSTMTIQTTSVGCTSTSVVLGAKSLTKLTSSTSSWPRGGLVILSAGLLGCCFLRRRMRPATLLLLAASATVFGLAGCGGSGSATTPTSTTATSPGTYTIQVTGTGTPTGGGTNVTATTSFNVVVQ